MVSPSEELVTILGGIALPCRRCEWSPYEKPWPAQAKEIDPFPDPIRSVAVGLQTVFPKPLTIGTLAQLLTALPSIWDAHTREAYRTFVRLSDGQTEIGSLNPFAFHFGINSDHWDCDGLPMGFREWVHSIIAPPWS